MSLYIYRILDLYLLHSSCHDNYTIFAFIIHDNKCRYCGYWIVNWTYLYKNGRFCLYLFNSTNKPSRDINIPKGSVVEYEHVKYQKAQFCHVSRANSACT